jgi:hypothetical protein
MAVWIAAVGMLVVLGIAAYYFTRERATEPSAATPAAGATQPDAALGRDGLKLNLPPLEMSDSFIRGLVGKLSTHPRVAAWLATDGLVRNFTVVVVNIAEGRTPAAQLRRLRPAAPFQVIQRGNETQIDPRSYERYNSLAEGDGVRGSGGGGPSLRRPEAAGRAGIRGAGVSGYSIRPHARARHPPFARDACRQRSHSRKRGRHWMAYADTRLEDLTGAQRQLLRFGARNQRIVQESLRKMALAMGIPEQRLPVAR